MPRKRQETTLFFVPEIENTTMRNNKKKHKEKVARKPRATLGWRKITFSKSNSADYMQQYGPM